MISNETFILCNKLLNKDFEIKVLKLFPIREKERERESCIFSCSS